MSLTFCSLCDFPLSSNVETNPHFPQTFFVKSIFSLSDVDFNLLFTNSHDFHRAYAPAISLVIS